MKKLCEIANVNPSKVFPHNLRKLFARIFYGIEKDIAKLADILGHGSVETTRIYIMTTGTEHRRKIEQPDPEDTEKTVLVPKPDFDKFDFSELIQNCSFEKAGTYSFRVREVAGSIGGITYDKAESRFDVVVGDADMDGYLEIQSVSTVSANTLLPTEKSAFHSIC